MGEDAVARRPRGRSARAGDNVPGLRMGRSLVISEWFDLSDGELRRRLLQRNVPSYIVEQLIAARETENGIDRIDELLT